MSIIVDHEFAEYEILTTFRSVWGSCLEDRIVRLEGDLENEVEVSQQLWEDLYTGFIGGLRTEPSSLSQREAKCSTYRFLQKHFWDCEVQNVNWYTSVRGWNEVSQHKMIFYKFKYLLQTDNILTLRIFINSVTRVLCRYL